MNQHLNQSTWSWFSQASIFNASDVSLIRKIISDFCYFPYRREVKCEISESEKRRWHPDVKVVFQTNEWINQNAIVDWAAQVLSLVRVKDSKNFCFCVINESSSNIDQV